MLWTPTNKKIARYTLDTGSIAPNSFHAPSNKNRKQTRLNATTLRRTPITNPDSQESSLKEIQNYPKIYEGKDT